jgi:hypothetical protein
VKAVLIGAGQITGHHLSCLESWPGFQDAASGILVREGRFDADDI